MLLSAELFWLHHIRVSVFFSTLLNDLKQKGLNRETYFGAPVRTGQSWIKTLAEVAGSLTDVGTGCCDEEGKTLATLTADLDYCGECCRGYDCLVFYMQWKLYNNNCPELNLKLIVIHYIHTIKKKWTSLTPTVKTCKLSHLHSIHKKAVLYCNPYISFTCFYIKDLNKLCELCCVLFKKVFYWFWAGKTSRENVALL